MTDDNEPFTGVLITSTEIVQTLFDIGEFRYQFEGEAPDVWRCTSQMQCDEIVKKVARGLRIFIEPPRMRRLQ